MNTIDELLYYCREVEPIGALLLSGEWGCRKTHLIDHELKENLAEEAVVLRISLFGITLPEEIHNAVKNAWLEAYYEIKGIDGFAKNLKKFRKAVEIAQFLPQSCRELATVDLTVFFSAKNKIDNKRVVLVFDDLERCRMNSVDVLGAINDYCENGGYHTIIVANQDKLDLECEVPRIVGKMQFGDDEDAATKGERGIAQITLDMPTAAGQGELSYTEIKEKIIQRTVQYIPDYEKIVHSVITGMKYEDSQYKAFIETCEPGLLELFAPDRNDPSGGEIPDNDIIVDSEQPVPPHNIRSLKCAIKDFYRVYHHLIENEILNLSNWLYSFTSYTIAYKADIVQNNIFSEETVRSLYPAFQSKYMLPAIKRWILYGIWDEDTLQKEIIEEKERTAAKTPAEMIKLMRIMDVDDEVLQDGFSDFLVLAYSGSLTLNEYALLVKNSCWARQYRCTIPVQIDWSKVNEGIDLAIEKIKTELPEGQILYSVIDKEQKKYFTDEEWAVYEHIAGFALGNEFIFFKNRKLYVDKMTELGGSAFQFIQNKRFDFFDEKMARATAQAFIHESNADKSQFIISFRLIWKANINFSDIQLEETMHGFSLLRELLQESISARQDKLRAFSIIHTEEFIKVLDELTGGGSGGERETSSTEQETGNKT